MEDMITKTHEYIAYKVDDKLKKIDERLGQEKVKRDPKLVLDFEREKQERIAQADIAGWLDKNAPEAKQLSKASHGPKYCHSGSKASTVFFHEPRDEDLVTTSCINEIEVDFVGNGAVSAVAGLLRLKAEGKWLFEYVLEGDASIFMRFTSDAARRAKWIEDLAYALPPRQIKSHMFAKQLYFPVAEDYHLLSPLYASSLSHEITRKIHQQLFSERAKDARDARKNEQPSDLSVVSFPKLGIVEYGGSKSQNISKLNAELRGKGYLLNCQPPTWRSKDKLPQTSHQFWRQLERATWVMLKELGEYLKKHQHSPAVRRIKDPITSQVEGIVECFFTLSANIRILGQEPAANADWSSQMKLTQPLALLLNPQRAEIDTEFREIRERKEWPEQIGKEFGVWLNQQLKTDQLILGDVERDHWAKIIKNTVSQLRDDLHYFQGDV